MTLTHTSDGWHRTRLAIALVNYAWEHSSVQVIGKLDELGSYLFFSEADIAILSSLLPDGRRVIAAEEIGNSKWCIYEAHASDNTDEIHWFDHDYDALNEWARIQRMYQTYYGRQDRNFDQSGG